MGTLKYRDPVSGLWVPLAFATAAPAGKPSATASYYRAGALALAAGSSVIIPWDTAVQAAEGIRYSGGVFTVDTPGWYLITSNVRVTPNAIVANAYLQLRLYINGSHTDFRYTSNATSLSGEGCQLAKVVYFDADDTFYIAALSSTAGSLSVTLQSNDVQVTRLDGGPALAVGGGLSGSGTSDDPLSMDAPWTDCSAEVRFCTTSSTAANAGQSVTFAKYLKIGKTVWFHCSGVIGSGAVVRYALLLPASAGVPAFRHYGGAPSIWASVGTVPAITGGPWMIPALTAYGFTTPGGVYADSIANQNLSFQTFYEVL